MLNRRRAWAALGRSSFGSPERTGTDRGGYSTLFTDSPGPVNEESVNHFKAAVTGHQHLTA